VLYEQRIDRDPVPAVDRPGERPLGLLGRAGAHDAQPVRDPVDVGVDRDRRDPVPEDEHAVRRLRPHAPQARQFLERLRDDPAEAPEDLARDLADDAGLGVVEPGSSDQRLDGRGGRAGQGGRIGVLGEQSRARDVGRLVPGPLGEYRPDQYLERVLGVIAQVGGPPIAGAVEARQSVEQGLPVERSVGHAAPAPRRDRRPEGAGSDGSVTPGSERSGSSLDPDGRKSSPMR